MTSDSVRRPEDAAPDLPRPASGDAGPPRPEQQLATILIVDDNEENRYLFSRFLRRSGFDVWEAGTGAEGLRRAADGPDLIILDVHLPDMNGHSVCRALRANPATVAIPILHVSASFSGATNRIAGLDNGADAYLIHPVELPELIATVNALLRARRAERRAWELARQWQATFDNIADGILLVDRSGTILRCNRACWTLLGSGPADLVGTACAQSLPALSIDEQRLSGICGSDCREVREVQLGDRWLRVTLDPLHEEPGRIVGAVCIVSDITERRRASDEQQRARDAAEAANRAKSEFLANVSHELRTPMNAILGMTDLALDESLSSVVRDYLATVRESAQGLLVLLNDLLDFSKIEAGKFKFETAPFALREALQESIKPLAIQAGEKGLAFDFQIADAVPNRLVGDALRLQQVVTNLVGNAVKFTDAGRVSVAVEVEEDAEEQAQLKFSVTDSGIGISVQDQSRIFAPFTQGDASITRHFSGTGLGLAISSELVNRMSGRLWLQSALGEGSTFYFTARFRKAPPSVEENATRPAGERRPLDFRDPRAPVTRSAKALRVLLVEDTPANQKLMVALLSKLGHTPIVAANGREALERLAGAEFDLILMDVQMPTMDGLQATVAIRAQERGTPRHVPIVAMTAYAMQGDKELCLSAGMDDYLSKPVDFNRLQEILLEYSL